MKKRIVSIKHKDTNEPHTQSKTHRELLTMLQDFKKAHPVTQYLLTLPSINSRLSMLANLTRMASILGTPLEEINWQNFRIKLVKSLLNQLRLRGLAPSTINATLAAVRGVVRQAWKLELIGDSDYLQIMEIKGVKKRDKAAGRIPTFKDLTLLLNSCAEDNNGALGDRDAAMLALIVSLQLTPGNMVKLNISDYDHSAKALRVHGKGGKERVITICDIGAWEALSTWLKRRGAKPGHLLCHVNKSGKVIIKALSSEAIYKALRSRMSKAKVCLSHQGNCAES